MIRVLLLLAELGAIAWIIQGLLKRFRKIPMTGTQIPFEMALKLVEKYGKNSNSFMTLYPGFEYFKSADPTLDGMVAYVDTTQAWVAAAEPLADEENQVRLLNEFANAASKFGKRALLIPADQAFAERACVAGFHAVMVGSEPTFILSQYPKTGTTWLDVVPVARQLSAKGAEVKELKASEITNEKREKLDQITSEWLGTRKTATLGFLNQVCPWLYSEQKRYFVITFREKTLAFLAAIPIKARKSWYLIDTIRTVESPPGTTELLLLQAMKVFSEEGIQEITFGVAPLSGLDLAQTIPIAQYEKHKMLYSLLQWIFNKGNQFYNFKPLFAYKTKFEPTVVRPVFLLYRGHKERSKLSISDLVSLLQAWLPHGLAHATGMGIFRLLSRFSFPDFIKSQLLPDTIVRSVPPNWTRLIYRCRLTASLTVMSTILYFLSTDSSGFLLPGIIEQWGFSWNQLLTHPLHALAFSPMIHPNLQHFSLGLLAMIVLTGGLEYLAGSGITAICFWIPYFFSYPIAASVFKLANMIFFPSMHQAEWVIGGSLGPLGCAGGLYLFFRNGKVWLPLLSAVALWGALQNLSLATAWILLGQWIAIFLGLIFTKIALRT